MDAQPNDVEPQLDGSRGGHRNDAVLVGKRRMIDRVVFQVELADADLLGQAVGFDQRA